MAELSQWLGPCEPGVGILENSDALDSGRKVTFPLPGRQAPVPYYLLDGGGYISTLWSPFESSSPITNNSRFLLKRVEDAQNFKHIRQQTNLQLFIPVEVPCSSSTVIFIPPLSSLLSSPFLAPQKNTTPSYSAKFATSGFSFKKTKNKKTSTFHERKE